MKVVLSSRVSHYSRGSESNLCFSPSLFCLQLSYISVECDESHSTQRTVHIPYSHTQHSEQYTQHSEQYTYHTVALNTANSTHTIQSHSTQRTVHIPYSHTQHSAQYTHHTYDMLPHHPITYNDVFFFLPILNLNITLARL